MKVVICDLCNQNEAERRFKVKEATKVKHQPWYTRYTRIDICYQCAKKLFDITQP